MPYTSVVVRVLVASPSDVAAERDAVTEVISNWNATHSREHAITLLTVRWEINATPELGHRPQAIINRQLVDEADVLVGVFWSRLGTPTGVAESGSAEEIERCRSRGIPVLLYFSSAPIEQERLDPSEYARLQEYKRKLRGEGLLETYQTVPEFREKLLRHLTDVARRFTQPHIPGQQSPSVAAAPAQPPDLTDEHITILRALSDVDEDSGEQVSADEIASELKMSLGRTKYLLDVLCDAAYIAVSRAVGRPPLYDVETKGREVLVRRGLL